MLYKNYAFFTGLILLVSAVFAESNDVPIPPATENVHVLTTKTVDTIGNATTTKNYENSNPTDPNLIPENIKKGVTIFGVVGTLSGTTPIQVSSLISRYTSNNNGTVTDNRTELIWLRNANCFNREYWEKIITQGQKVSMRDLNNTTQDWETATRIVAELHDGQCDLNDGSVAGNWRLPTIEEWKEMASEKYERPALSNKDGTGQWTEGDIFVGVKTDYYWSSTPFASNMSLAWYMILSVGSTGFVGKTNSFYVWPVRDK